MRKVLSLLLILAFAAGTIISCGKEPEPDFSKIYFDAKQNVTGSEHLVGSPKDEYEFKSFLRVYFLYVIGNNRQRDINKDKSYLELVDGTFRLEVYWVPGKAENLPEEDLAGLNAESMYKALDVDGKESHYKIWISWKNLDTDAILELTTNENVEMIRFFELGAIEVDD